MAKVIVLGGGVAGMSAAHELIERGFEVEVFERQLIPGGKARSIPVFESLDDHGSRGVHGPAVERWRRMGGLGVRERGRFPWFPGEHGFRFFPSFYKHVVDTMKRIPFGAGVVTDNLVDTTRILLAQYDKPGIVLPSRFPRGLADVRVILNDFLYLVSRQNKIPFDEMEFFAGKIWQIITSCEERRFAEYEKIGWWEFIDAGNRSEAYQKFLGHGITRSLVAAQAQLASTKTIGDIFVQLLFGIVEPGPSADRLLNGPTNRVWVDPWLDYLRSRGVRYHMGALVRSIECAGGEIRGATVELGGRTIEARGDYYLCALPIERITPLITDSMKRADPSLANLSPLSENVQWMNGLQFYLSRDVKITHGHTIYIDSPWALTSVSQEQFWPDIDLADYGDGQVRGILSIDISDWNTKGFSGKTAHESSRHEIAHECWEQLKRSLNVGEIVLRDQDLHYWFLDPDIVSDPRDRRQAENVEPLLVNYIDTWRLRPEAVTAIPNFFLASDYVRTYTDLATMEAANEAARRAVNGIIEASGAGVAHCSIWNLHEPEIFAPLREHDRSRWEAGLPWDDTLMTVALSTLDVLQKAVGLVGTPDSGGGREADTARPDAAAPALDGDEGAALLKIAREIVGWAGRDPQTAPRAADAARRATRTFGRKSSGGRVRIVQKR